MKKISATEFFYYITPFILVPALVLICEHFDHLQILRMSPFLLIILLVLISAIMGHLSPSDKTFDPIMTVFMPLALFCLMLIGGFLDKSDLGSRFHLDRAFRCACQSPLLIAYILMGLITFLSSFKNIRISKRLKSKALQRKQISN